MSRFSNYIISLILVSFGISTKGQTTYVPDDNFESYLEANGMGDGIANNNYVTTASISTVTNLNIANQNISNITGIEDFNSLQVFDCQNNQISSIDLSNNSSLTNITIGYNPPLFQLDLRNGNNINITNLNVSTAGILRCISVDDENWSNSNWTNNNNFYSNCLKFSNNCFQKVYVPDDDFEAFLETRALTLNIQPYLSNNSYCAGVGFFSNETVSVGDSNSLGDGIAGNDSVYLGNLIAIEALSPSVGINFEGIQFMKNLKYFNYNVWPKTNFTSLDFSQNDSLEIIMVTESHLTDINLPTNSNLEYLDLRNNHISNIDLTNQAKLTYLDISDQSELSSQNNTTRILNQLDVSNSPLITTLKCNENNLSTLNISSNTNIENLYCQQNELASLNLSALNNLKHLECNGNNLTSLSVSSSPLLNYLECRDNQLSSLSLSNNSKIETLFCPYNTINSLDLTGLDSLRYLDCQSNGMTNLNVSTNPDLLELQCGYNNLSQINLSNNLNLDWIHIDQNPNLTFLDLSSNLNLTRVSFQASSSDGSQLSCVDLRNGNNSNMSLSATSNNNLYCISVDDTAYANANWSSSVASHTGFSENCNLISSDFTANRTSICKGSSVQFSNNSSINSYSSSWNFGDGNSSSATNPTNTYANSGSYTVSLNINNGCSNDIETKNNFITVNNQSNVINNIDTSVVDSIIIAGVSHYLSSTIQEILVAQNGCDSIINHNITINKLLSSELNATDTVVCIGDVVTIGVNILDSAERSFDPFIIKVDAQKTLVLDKFHGQYHIKSTDSANGNVEYFYNLIDNDTVTFTENSGTYTLEIHPTGQVPFHGVYFDGSWTNDHFEEITEIISWGTVEWTSFQKGFQQCSDLRNVNSSSTPDLSLVNNMSYMFSGCWKYFNSSLNHWDVSNVTNMSYMFQGCYKYNQSLNNWDVTNVADMSGMFMSAFRDFIYTFSLNNWDVGNVTNMYGMFTSTGFNGNISNWDVSNVTDMTYMFHWAQEFNQNLNSWNLNPSVKIQGIFSICNNFNQPLNNWDVSGVQNFGTVFWNCYEFNQDISSWDVSNGTNFASMFQGAYVFNQNISSWDVSSGTSFNAMFGYCYQFNQNLNSWNMSNATAITGMFQYCTNFNQPLNSWNISGASSLRYMFKEASSFNQDISNWDVSNVTEMDYIFDNATSFNQPLDSWNVSNVTNFEKAFNNCTSFNQSLSSWDVSSASNLDLMFFGSSNFNSNLSNWCVSNFSSEPLGFSTQTSLINNNKPLWGTCP